MARMKYLVNKQGAVIRHKVKERNIKANYVQVGRVKGKPVYQKKRVKPSKEITSKTYSFKKLSKERKVVIKSREKARVFRAKQPSKEEKGEQLVEVKGLVSAFAVSDGIARRKNSPFSAEMLFTWWGNKGFDERRLLNSAWEILLNSLADIDRMNMSLISSLEMKENRGGIESVTEVRVESEHFNEMEFTVFIPDVHGKAYYKGSAKVVL